MRRLVVLLPLALVVGLLGTAAPTTAHVTPSPVAARGAQGDRHAMPSAYSWLSRTDPASTYSIALVRGRTPGSALRTTGEIKKRLGRMTPQEAALYVIEHADLDTYEYPAVVQVQRLGNSVVVYEPFGFRPAFRLARLSANGIAAAFSTTQGGSKEAKVAKRGDVVRSFSVRRRPPQHNALPEERGLDFGAPGQNPFATGWAFNERLTLTHISRRWFHSAHPTFVVKGPTH